MTLKVPAALTCGSGIDREMSVYTYMYVCDKEEREREKEGRKGKTDGGREGGREGGRGRERWSSLAAPVETPQVGVVLSW